MGVSKLSPHHASNSSWWAHLWDSLVCDFHCPCMSTSMFSVSSSFMSWLAWVMMSFISCDRAGTLVLLSIAL